MDRETLGLQFYVSKLSMFQQAREETDLETNTLSPQPPIQY